MQDISSILTSLHAMEADLAPTNETIVSLQARNTVPTYDTPLIWMEDYTKYDIPPNVVKPNDHKHTKLTAKLWNDKKIMKDWQKIPIFLLSYPHHHKTNQDSIATAIEKSTAAILATEVLLDTQKQSKLAFDKETKEILEMCDNTKKIDTNSNGWVKILEETTKSHKSLAQKLSDDIDKSKASIKHQETITGQEKKICTHAFEFEQKRNTIFEEIVTLVDQNEKDVKKIEQIRREYTPEIIKQARNEVKSSADTTAASKLKYDEALKKTQAAAFLVKQNGLARRDWTTSNKISDEAMHTLSTLISKIPAASIPAPHPPAQDAQPSPEAAPHAPELALLHQQQQALHVAQDAAKEALSESADKLHTQQHALVAQEVELATHQLAQTQNQIAANAIVTEQIVQVDHANVAVQHEHVAEAQHNLADVQKQLLETQQALAHPASPAQAGILSHLYTRLVSTTANLQVEKQKEIVAKDVEETDLALQKQQRAEAHQQATLAAADCEKAAIDAQVQTKADVLTFTEAQMLKEEAEKELKDCELLLVTTKASLEQAQKTNKETDILSVQALISRYQALVIEKQQHLQTTSKKMEDETKTLRKSRDTYNIARTSFHNAQGLLHSGADNAQGATVTQMPDLSDDNAFNVLFKEAKQTIIDRRKQATASLAPVQLAENALAKDLETLHALEHQLAALNIDTKAPNQAAVPAAVSQKMKIYDDKLLLWHKAVAKCAETQALLEFHEKCSTMAQEMLTQHKDVAILTDALQSASANRKKAFALLTEQITDNKIEGEKRSLMLEKNKEALLQATAELTKAMTEANKEIEMLRQSSTSNPQDAVFPDLIQEIDIESIMTERIASAQTKLAGINLHEFELLLTKIEDTLKTTEAPAAQAEPAAQDGAAVAAAANDKAVADKRLKYDEAYPAAMAALKLARDTNSPMSALCEEMAVLLVNQTNINPKVTYFKQAPASINLADMLKHCTEEKQKNDTLLESTGKRAVAANKANDEASAAAHTCVTNMINLSRHWSPETYNLWLDAQHTPPEKFQWTEELVKQKKYQQGIRISNMNIKSDAFAASLNNLNRQQHELAQLMTKVLEFEAAYHAAEAVYKALEADYAIDKKEEKRNALGHAQQKSQDTHHEYTQAGNAENGKINECTVTYKQAIADGDALLPLTSDSAHFQDVWTNLKRLRATDYTQQKDTIRRKRTDAAEHQRKLDARNILIAQEKPLKTAFDAIGSKMFACIRKIVDDFNILVRTKQLTLSNREAFTLARKNFDGLLQQLRLDVDAYNKAQETWLQLAQRISRCMGIGSKDDVVQQFWINQCSDVEAMDFDQLLKSKRIVVSSILAIPPEAQMAPPEKPSLPKQPEGAPQNPIVSPQNPRVSPLIPVSPQALPLPQPASLDKVVVRPSDAPHDRRQPQEDQSKYLKDIEEYRPIYNYKGPSHSTSSSPPRCSFKLSMLDFAARLLPLVYPPTRAVPWRARPAVARYAHADRARTAGGSLELHALCARIAHIAWLVHESDNFEPFAAHRFLIEVPEHSRLLLRALSRMPHNSLYAARAAPSREHKNSAAIRECLSRSSLAPLRACAAAAVAAALPKDEGGSDSKFVQSSQQYV